METACAEERREQSGGWPAYASTVIVCFSGWEGGAPCGELWSYCYREPRPFRGFDGLIFTLDEIMDESGRPQAWCRPRALAAKTNQRGRRGGARATGGVLRTPYYAPDALLMARGELCTAAVRVQCRQHASMQGELKVGGKLAYFRSALELMRYLREELGSAPAAEVK